MRGACNILVKGNGADDECGEPCVHSQPCLCDTCAGPGGMPDFHDPTHFCAEHYDRIMNPPKECWTCDCDDHYPADCPEPNHSFDGLLGED